MRTLSLIAIALTVLAGAVLAGEPVPWGNNGSRNVVIEAEGLPETIGEENELWSHELGGGPFFNVISVYGDKAICITSGRNAVTKRMDRRDGALIVFNVHTGEVLLEVGIPGLGGGYRAEVPIVEDGKLYNRAGEDPICIDLETGETIWESNAISDWGIQRCHGPSAMAVMVGDYYAMPTCSSGFEWTYAINEVSQEWPWYPKVMLFDKHTGEAVAMDDVHQRYTWHGQWAGASTGKVDGKDMLFWGSGEGYIYAWEVPEEFEPGEDGIARLKEVWRCDANPHEYRYFPNGQHRPYRNWDQVKLPHGQKQDPDFWGNPSKFGFGEVIGIPVFYEGRLYVTMGRDYEYSDKRGHRAFGAGALTCIDPTGEGDVTETHKVWVSKEIDRTFNAPSIVDGLIFITDLAGYLHCLDAETGEHYWKQDIESKVWNYGQIVADGKIYVQNSTGKFYILRAAKEKELLCEFELEGMNGPGTGITDGVIVVATPRRIAAYHGPDYDPKEAR